MNGRFVRSVLLVALIPALAIGAPRRGRKPPKKPAKPVKTEPVEPPSEPTPPPDVPADPPKDAKTTPTTPAPPSTTPATPAGGGAGAGSGSGTGGGSGAAAEPAEPPPTGNDVDVDTLRQEYLSLRDELFKSRARANTVASQLYSTRIQIKLTYTTGRYYSPAKSTIRLDGASVFEDATGAIAGDDSVRFDGYVAPGRHLVTFRVEATGKDDDTFTSTTETQIVVKAVAGKDLLVLAKAKDSGDIAYEWKRKEKGSYGLGIDVAVKTTKREDGGASPPAAPPASAAKGAKK